MTSLRRPLLVLLALALLVAACGDDGAQDDRPLVIASTAVWGEVVEALDPEDRLRVEVLLPAGADPHEFVPSAAQAADLRRADLIVVNGLNLEEGLGDAVDAAAADGIPVFEAAEAADPLPFSGNGHDHTDEEHADEEHADEEHSDEEHVDTEHADEEHSDEDHADEDHADEHDHGGLDPHVWLDPVRIGIAAQALAAELDARFPDLGATDAAIAYADRMATVATEMEALLSDVEDRRIVSNHDAFGYFADRFDFEVVGVVIPGGSTDAAASSQELAALADRIDEEGIRAIFIDTTAPTTVAEALAAEFGGEVSVVRLVTAGPDGEESTDTIEEFLLENARLIAEALGAG